MIDYTWERYDASIGKLQEKLSGREFNIIVGIARAGLIPAVHLAHKLNVRDFISLTIVRTLSDNVNAEKLPKPLVRPLDDPSFLMGKRVLIVDDIMGEGVTMNSATEYLTQFGCDVTRAAVVFNEGNYKSEENYETFVDVIGEAVNGWVNFPWC